MAVKVGLAVGLLLLLLWRPTTLAQRLENQLVDVRTRWAAGRRAPDPRIVIATVSDGDVQAVCTSRL